MPNREWRTRLIDSAMATVCALLLLLVMLVVMAVIAALGIAIARWVIR
jgi:hypothetical protein